MNYELIRREDLVNNPTARVPVCLCLDVSGSMNQIVGGESELTGEKLFLDGKEWNIATSGITAISELTKGVKSFYDAIREDEVAVYSAEICMITFGGNGAQIVMDFANIERQAAIEELFASGGTPMGEAVNLALDCLDRRKNEYKEKGVDYYQPWLVLMTDGESNGSTQELQRAIERTQNLVNNKKLTVFPIGFGNDADMNTLAKFSPNRSPLKLKGANFKELFQWLSQSVSRTSQSLPGETIPLDIDGLKGWAEL